MLKLQGRLMATGLGFPEGPVALPDGSVLVVEIAAGRLTRVQPNGELKVIAQVGGGPNGAASGPDGHCYVCNNGGFSWRTDDGFTRPTGEAADYAGGCIQRVDLATGKVRCSIRTATAFRCAARTISSSTHREAFGLATSARSSRIVSCTAPCTTHAPTARLIRRAAFPVLTPNGIGLSPDGGTLYLAETETSRLWSYPVIRPGELKLQPFPSPNGGRLVHGLPGYQRFDSLAVEEGGNICVATLVRGGISVFSPSGELLEFHEAPEGYCTNLCFGGPDMRTAYITLSGYGQLFAARWPRPGLRLAA